MVIKVSREDMAQLEANERRRGKILRTAAEKVSEKLGVAPQLVQAELVDLLHEFGIRHWESTSTERAKQAQDDILAVAEAAERLADALRALGFGAVTVLQRCAVKDLKRFSTVGPEGFPDHLPGWILGLSDEENIRLENERQRGGRWACQMETLASLARVGAATIEREGFKSGPKTMGPALFGTPEDHLARACMEFALAHGGDAPVARLMMSAVREAETGVPLKKGAGRKTLRRVSRA